MNDVVEALCRAVRHVPGETEAIVRAHVGAIAPLASLDEREQIVREAVAALDGLGSLERWLGDPDVDEVLVNADGRVWIEQHGVPRPVGRMAAAQTGIVLERILAPLGRRLDRTTPVVDARLPDGSRVCAVIPPVAVDGPCLSVRRFRPRPLSFSDFTSPAVVTLLDEITASRCNVVIAGATSSGKTSLLNAMLSTFDPHERIVTLEDTAELQPPSDHLVRLEARPATTDGVQAISLEALVRTAMRLRPDRLIVGEVRGPEVVGLVQGLNTGHIGSWSTTHANGAAEALGRLESLVLQAAPSWPLAAVRAELTRSIDVIVHVTRTGTATRRIVEVDEVVHGGAPHELRPLAVGDDVVGVLRRRR